jgi:dipeptide/tripeptide permease
MLMTRAATLYSGRGSHKAFFVAENEIVGDAGALLFLIPGNGAFKPNISTQVGSLYPPGDPQRDCDFRTGKRESSPPLFRTPT